MGLDHYVLQVVVVVSCKRNENVVGKCCMLKCLIIWHQYNRSMD